MKGPVRQALSRLAAPLGLALATLPTVGAAAPAPPAAYQPSMGDLMTMAVQPRHIKLGIATRARNWHYAAYEVDELKNAFNRVARTIPTYRNADMAALFGADILPRVERTAAAIKAHNGPAADREYTGVTAACNACHRSLAHPFVVIRAPAASAYSDQQLATH